jgi:hypothetical protein
MSSRSSGVRSERAPFAKMASDEPELIPTAPDEQELIPTDNTLQAHRTASTLADPTYLPDPKATERSRACTPFTRPIALSPFRPFAICYLLFAISAVSATPYVGSAFVEPSNRDLPR